ESEQAEKKASVVGQPLPRLWKTEPEEETEQDNLGPSSKKASKDDDKAASKATPRPKPASRKVEKSRATRAPAQPGEKQVLLEDTPSLDTYESRRRARLIMGALSIACVLLTVWITYRVFLYDPSTIRVQPEDPMLMAGPPMAMVRAAADVDKEARYTFNNA